ncbi:hypothetical protein [Patulibacter defluvii]|uniref:hypothetical protein n=1 Tax=Patulibacter defluvii TaxID=3095358 RepID=UPI002A7552BD|nr:hypothetical protein [Patulibacter sp. DM4]
MPKPASSPTAVAAFEALVADLADAGAVAGALFGMRAAKLGTKVFAGLFGDALVVRLGADEVERRIAAGEGGPFDPSGRGRPMKDWLVSAAAADAWAPLAAAALAVTAAEA